MKDEIKDEAQEEGQDKKKLKQSEISTIVHPRESQEEANQTCVNDLPPEILMKVLKNLDTSSLLSSRLLNRKWNQMSSEISRSHNQIWLKFVFFTSKNTFKERGTKSSLKKFIECFKNSTNFPCVRFYFKLSHDQLKHKDLKSFLFHCKNSVKTLKLDLKHISSLEDVDKTVKIIRDLLLNKLPNLTDFGLNLTFDSQAKLQFTDQMKSQFKLYPKTSDGLKNKQRKRMTSSFQLPHLKTLRVSPTLLTQFPGIFQYLLVAAVNLKKIEGFGWSYLGTLTLEQCKFLHSLGKLHLVHAAEVLFSVELFSWIQSSIKEGNPVVFQLSRMSLNNRRSDKAIKRNPSIWPEATKFINWLFDSVKDTLTRLEIGDLTFLKNLRFPTFTKLTELTICSDQGVIIPRGSVSLQNKENSSFPVLHEIHLSTVNLTADFFGDDPLLSIPSVQKVELFVNQTVNEHAIRKMAMMCPNLKTLQFSMPPNHFPVAAPFIWTHMTSLHSLYFGLYLADEEPSSVDVNSAITGISSQRLLNTIKQINQMPISKKLKRSLKMSKRKVEKMREGVSVLDLKDLKELDITVSMGPNVPKWKTRSFLDVSYLCAFDFMPNTVVTTQIQ